MSLTFCYFFVENIRFFFYTKRYKRVGQYINKERWRERRVRIRRQTSFESYSVEIINRDSEYILLTSKTNIFFFIKYLYIYTRSERFLKSDSVGRFIIIIIIDGHRVSALSTVAVRRRRL